VEEPNQDPFHLVARRIVDSSINTTVGRRYVFQPNRKERVFHCRQRGLPPPSGKHAQNTGSALQKGET